MPANPCKNVPDMRNVPSDKKNFFAGIAWEFFSKFWIPVGSEKERRLLLADERLGERGRS